jgi:hypothetical protein
MASWNRAARERNCYTKKKKKKKKEKDTPFPEFHPITGGQGERPRRQRRSSEIVRDHPVRMDCIYVIEIRILPNSVTDETIRMRGKYFDGLKRARRL